MNDRHLISDRTLINRAIELKVKKYSLFFGVATGGSSGFLSCFEHIRLTFDSEGIPDGCLIPLGFGMCDVLPLSLCSGSD